MFTDLLGGEECQEKRLYKHFTKSEITAFNMNVFIILVEQTDSFNLPDVKIIDETL